MFRHVKMPAQPPYYQLLNQLNKTDESKRLPIILQNIKKFKSIAVFVLFARTLPEKQRLEFLKNKGLPIHNAIERWTFVRDIALGNILSPNDYKEFVRFNIDKITDFSDLAVALEHIPDTERLSLAIDYSQHIEHANQLARILRLLKPSERMGFARRHADKIPNGFELEIVLNALPDDEKIAFTLEQIAKITSAQQVYRVFLCLPYEDKLKLLMKCNVNFTLLEENDVKDIINKLSPQQINELLHAPRIVSRLHIRSYIPDMVRRLPVHTAIDFVMDELFTHYPAIEKHKVDLVLRGMIANEYKHVVKTRDSLVTCREKIHTYSIKTSTMVNMYCFELPDLTALATSNIPLYQMPKPITVKDNKQQDVKKELKR